MIPSKEALIRLVSNPIYQERYQNAFLDTIRKIKTITGSPWVSANTSAENLFYLRENRMGYADAFDTFLREDYIRPGFGLDGYFGIAKMWDSFAIAKSNKHSVIIAHAGWAGTIPTVHSKTEWEARIATGLAMYYFVNVPGKTSYNSWNNSYNYGSGNANIYNFYIAGVPKNIAYQPSAMLAVNIGKPTKSIQAWPGQTVEPLLYTARIPSDDFAFIGNSTQVTLSHPELATNTQAGHVPVIPSNIYYAWQSSKKIRVSSTADYPSEVILARDYTNGLVLYQTNFFGGQPNFMSVIRQITLPGYYHRVNYDGTLQPASNTITLTGYEGVVLLKANQ